MRLPLYVMLQAIIPRVNPRVFRPLPQANLVQDGRDQVWVIGQRALLIDGIVRKRDIEVVLFLGEVEFRAARFPRDEERERDEGGAQILAEDGEQGEEDEKGE